MDGREARDFLGRWGKNRIYKTAQDLCIGLIFVYPGHQCLYKTVSRLGFSPFLHFCKWGQICNMSVHICQMGKTCLFSWAVHVWALEQSSSLCQCGVKFCSPSVTNYIFLLSHWIINEMYQVWANLHSPFRN